MGRRTGLITYNFNERKREHNGVDRVVDIPSAMRVCNGPAVQELIKSGDVYGYFGHNFRELYGLEVPESVVVNGKAIALEPAVRTVHLHVHEDGTVEHEQEFLNTRTGQMSARLYGDKAFGFSSAFDTREVGGVRFIVGFHGFDFVRAPNYHGNRGYMLDSLASEEDRRAALLLDHVAMLDSMGSMLDQQLAAYAALEGHCERLHAENDQLIRMLAKLKAKGAGAMLDSTTTAGAEKTTTRMVIPASVMLDSANAAMQMQLTPFEQLPGDRSAGDEAEALLAAARQTIARC